MLSYPDTVIAPQQFQYCPMCTTPLVRKVLFDDNIPRVTCPDCGWIQLVSNVVGVAVVARNDEGIVAILPPGEDGVALPAGLVEYGEDPADAAVREVLEETGLVAKIVACLGWHFVHPDGWPGPMVQFFYEAELIGGALAGSDEGDARIYPFDGFPAISSTRRGSQRAMQLYLAQQQR
ncbi:MAG: NUDIX domain-containing protein [Caldilineaceae bacterium]|nr:NUDIX domain-containing protein [Caldilineaceae bacterium]